MFIRLECAKNGRTYDVGEFDSLPEASREYLIQYGVDQSGTDSHASITRKGWTGTEAEFADAVDAKVSAWVTKIQTGQLRARVVEDPKKVMVRELAKLQDNPETKKAVASLLAYLQSHAEQGRAA